MFIVTKTVEMHVTVESQLADKTFKRANFRKDEKRSLPDALLDMKQSDTYKQQFQLLKYQERKYASSKLDFLQIRKGSKWPQNNLYMAPIDIPMDIIK